MVKAICMGSHNHRGGERGGDICHEIGQRHLRSETAQHIGGNVYKIVPIAGLLLLELFSDITRGAW